MTIRCFTNSDRGSMQVVASGIPNGPATLERLIAGKAPYLLRGGVFDVELGGFSKEDPEVPFGVPLTYRLSVSPPDTLVQTNHVLTPTFTRGAQGWRAGAGRTLSVAPGSAGSSSLVGAIGTNVPGATPTYPAPTLVGSVTTPAAGVTGTSYTLTPTSSVAVGDWLYLTHHQVAGGAAPTLAGWQWLATAVQGDVDVTVWRRRREAPDGSYTVQAPAVGTKLAVLVWVRGASDSFVPTVGAVGTTITSVGSGVTRLTIPPVPTVSRPSLLLTVVGSTLTIGTSGVGAVAGAEQTFRANTGTRQTTVAAIGLPDTGLAPPTPVDWPQGVAAAAGVQITVPSDAPVTQRIIATTPIGPMRKSGQPARLTGRVKFRTSDLWLWQDVKEQGTWANLRSTKTTWASVKSASSTAGDDYMRLYVDVVYSYTATANLPGTSTIWNNWVASFTGSNRQPIDDVIIAAMAVIRSGTATPDQRALLRTTNPDELVQLLIDIHTTPTRSAFLLSGAIPLSDEGKPVDLIDDELAIAVIAADQLGLPITAGPTTVPVGSLITQTFVAPVQVIAADAARTGQWVDFSFRFTLGQDVPAGAVIRFMHGMNTREFATTWQFDRIGVTSGEDLAEHDPLYYMDGDSAVPAQPEDNLLPDRTWTTVTPDARMVWTGPASASTSQFYGPSRVYSEATGQINAPAASAGYQQPVYLNDPIAPARGHWYDLIDMGDLRYSARRALLDVLGRGAQIAVSSTRGWAEGELTLLTRDLATRGIALSTFQTGRILLLRNPNPDYPEDTWYISIGDVRERRLNNGDQRRAERLWEVPFVQVERPVGLIETSAGRTWQQVKDEWPTWAGVRADNETWLELLYPTEKNLPPVVFDGALYPGAPNAYPALATFPSGG